MNDQYLSVVGMRRRRDWVNFRPPPPLSRVFVTLQTLGTGAHFPNPVSRASNVFHSEPVTSRRSTLFSGSFTTTVYVPLDRDSWSSKYSSLIGCVGIEVSRICFRYGKRVSKLEKKKLSGKGLEQIEKYRGSL